MTITALPPAPPPHAAAPPAPLDQARALPAYDLRAGDRLPPQPALQGSAWAASGLVVGEVRFEILSTGYVVLRPLPTGAPGSTLGAGATLVLPWQQTVLAARR